MPPLAKSPRRLERAAWVPRVFLRGPGRAPVAAGDQAPSRCLSRSRASMMRLRVPGRTPGPAAWNSSSWAWPVWNGSWAFHEAGLWVSVPMRLLLRVPADQGSAAGPFVPGTLLMYLRRVRRFDDPSPCLAGGRGHKPHRTRRAPRARRPQRRAKVGFPLRFGLSGHLGASGLRAGGGSPRKKQEKDEPERPTAGPGARGR